MIEHRPRITVVIPTRERADVLAACLATVTSQTYENLEIIVSDNCSQDNTKAVVAALRDPRITYLTTGKRVSMSDNWELALSHVKPGWVTIVGDDDGLFPGALGEVARLIATTGAQAIRSALCMYLWPSVTRCSFGRLRVPLRHGHEVRDSGHWQRDVLAGHAPYAELPVLYTGGFVDTAVLSDLRRGRERIYQSCIPDVYSGLAISSVLPTYVYSHAPLAISGASAHSIGVSSFVTAGDQSPDAPIHKFRSEGNMPFHADVPLCADGSYPRSTHAFVLESYLQSAFLRPTETVGLHAQQLELILATGAIDDAALREWARSFARAHELAFDAIDARSRGLRRRLRVRSAPGRLRHAVAAHILGSEDLPLPTVYEASIAAAVVRASPPGGATRLRAAARRMMTRLPSSGEVERWRLSP